MRKWIYLSASVLAATQLSAFANCGTMQIEVTNESPVMCVLKKFTIHHGNYEWYPETTIMPGQTDIFDIDKYGYGPDVELEYSCGGKKIAFRSQMNRAVFVGKTPKSTILNEGEPFDLTHSDIHGSCLKDKNTPGIVMWVIHYNPFIG